MALDCPDVRCGLIWEVPGGCGGLWREAMEQRLMEMNMDLEQVFEGRWVCSFFKRPCFISLFYLQKARYLF